MSIANMNMIILWCIIMYLVNEPQRDWRPCPTSFAGRDFWPTNFQVLIHDSLYPKMTKCKASTLNGLFVLFVVVATRSVCLFWVMLYHPHSTWTKLVRLYFPPGFPVSSNLKEACVVEEETTKLLFILQGFRARIDSDLLRLIYHSLCEGSNILMR